MDFLQITPSAHALRFSMHACAAAARVSPDQGKGRTPMKLGFRQGLASAAIFGAVLFTLVSLGLGVVANLVVEDCGHPSGPRPHRDGYASLLHA